jgi:hypothetical protein
LLRSVVGMDCCAARPREVDRDSSVRSKRAQSTRTGLVPGDAGVEEGIPPIGEPSMVGRAFARLLSPSPSFRFGEHEGI